MIDAQLPAAAPCRPATVNRYDGWLSEQLAAAHHDECDGDGFWRSRSGNVNPVVAVAQMQPTCGGVARGQVVSDASSDGKFVKRIEDGVSSASEAGSAGMPGAQDFCDASPTGNSMHEPFAWRGKLPGATARAAALEIRHFCALSQQYDGSRALSAAPTHAKGKGSVPAERHKPPERRKKPKSRLIVPHSPALATARRVHGEMGNGKGLTESKEHVRRVTDAGRKRATVLAGHFRGSYAQRAAVWGRLRKAGAEVGYATLAK